MKKLITILAFIFAFGLSCNVYANNDLDSFIEKAEQGDAQAQTNLGVMYYKGHGLTQDKSKAKQS